jgi:hypothetical protein
MDSYFPRQTTCFILPASRMSPSITSALPLKARTFARLIAGS